MQTVTGIIDTVNKKAALIALSSDARAIDPVTIRAIMREAGLMSPASDRDGSAEFFLHCVTIRQLIAAGATAKAALLAAQIGCTLVLYDASDGERLSLVETATQEEKRAVATTAAEIVIEIAQTESMEKTTRPTTGTPYACHLCDRFVPALLAQGDYAHICQGCFLAQLTATAQKNLPYSTDLATAIREALAEAHSALGQRDFFAALDACGGQQALLAAITARLSQ